MSKNINEEVLVSGKTSFKIEVPYKLIETGEKGIKKPLLVYLHGFGDHLKSFLKTCRPFLENLSAYHLFVQGPYPLYDETGKKNVSKWGRAWYLYDGKQGQFIKSLELTAEFLQTVIDNLVDHIQVSRLCIIGHSMGGYQAGYFALTRWKHVNELVVAGGRIKTEILNENWHQIKHLQIFAIHGSRDKTVDYKSQKAEIKKLSQAGINANFKVIDQKHIFNKEFINEICDWLFEKGYQKNETFKKLS